MSRRRQRPPGQGSGEFQDATAGVVADPGRQVRGRTSIGEARRAEAVSVRIADAAVGVRVGAGRGPGVEDGV